MNEKHLNTTLTEMAIRVDDLNKDIFLKDLEIEMLKDKIAGLENEIKELKSKSEEESEYVYG